MHRRQGLRHALREGAQPVMAAIRDAIMRSDSVTNQRWVEADLSAQFDASRAAVRSALLELTNEGLVERVQNRGARVRAGVTGRSGGDLRVQMVVERLCAAKAAERVGAKEIQESKRVAMTHTFRHIF